MEQVIEIIKTDPRSMILGERIRVRVEPKSVKEYVRLLSKTFPDTSFAISNTIRRA